MYGAKEPKGLRKKDPLLLRKRNNKYSMDIPVAWLPHLKWIDGDHLLMVPIEGANVAGSSKKTDGGSRILIVNMTRNPHQNFWSNQRYHEQDSLSKEIWENNILPWIIERYEETPKALREKVQRIAKEQSKQKRGKLF